MRRASTGVRLAAVLVLLAALLPALAHVTSPWWTPPALGWAGRRFWSAELHPRSASFNPFTLSLEARGGTLAVPAGAGMDLAADVKLIRAEADIAELMRNRRLGSLELDLDSVTLSLDPARKSAAGGSARRTRGPAPEKGEAAPRTPPPDAAGPDRREWSVALVSLRVNRGTIRYGLPGKGREVSVDLGLEADYRDVKDVGQLGQRLLDDLAQQAAFGFLTERLGRP